jgi:enterochelin esterase-like enzyme
MRTRSYLAPLSLLLLGAPPERKGPRFEIRFSELARADALTGRVYLILARDGSRPPVDQVGPTGVPLYGKNVEALKAGEPVAIDGSVLGHPIASVDDLPAGAYFAQAFVNVYTRFERADGHTVWLHKDQWEGQSWRRSPGNLYSKPTKISLDPAEGGSYALLCDQVIPPVEIPADTELVRRIQFPSKILSEWWGQPIELGATVLLPKGYGEHPEASYPVNYVQDHFSLRAPGGFGSGRDFDALWLAEDTPRFLYVTFQHPTPYYDDSYAVNSENNGPYGDALVQELIPAVEAEFRAIREPWARLLSGGSTGGWEALALQIFHPGFFGGCWASCPDPVDFRSHQIVNIYEDDNAYWVDKGFTRVERPNQRRVDGNIDSMMKDENHFELVVGDRSRSGGQWDIWEATFSPVGEDGYPRRIWDKRTGVIDHDVAAYWKEHYDLRHILQSRWSTLGPALAGKLHVYVGDMDSFYLNNAVGLLEEFLRSAKDPPYGGTVEYARCKPHCWGPEREELLRLMLSHVEKSAPPGADLTSWRYR